MLVNVYEDWLIKLCTKEHVKINKNKNIFFGLLCDVLTLIALHMTDKRTDNNDITTPSIPLS